jgi:hypothetical protein
MVVFNALTSIGIRLRPTRLILCSVKFSCDCLDCVLLTPRILRYAWWQDCKSMYHMRIKPPGKISNYLNVVDNSRYLRTRWTALFLFLFFWPSCKVVVNSMLRQQGGNMLIIHQSCHAIVKQNGSHYRINLAPVLFVNMTVTFMDITNCS